MEEAFPFYNGRRERLRFIKYVRGRINFMNINATQRPIAIVTGASRSRGIGAAVCRALAEAKVDIFFTYWQAHDKALYGQEKEGYQQLLETVRAMGVRCEFIEADLSLPQAAEQIMDAVEARLGYPSILVNNAAHDDTQLPFDQIDATILDTYYAVNMRGTILLSIEFARRFTQSSGGRIINLTSGQGIGAMPGKIPYIATKGAIEAFTITLAAEVAPCSGVQAEHARLIRDVYSLCAEVEQDKLSNRQ